jgi:hypothetical protein
MTISIPTGTVINSLSMYTRAEPVAPTAPIDPELLIIMQWLDNADSVTQEQLEANMVRTVARVDSIIKGPKTFEFANALTIDAAAYFTTRDNKELTEKWVYKFFEASGENRQDYTNTIKGTK